MLEMKLSRVVHQIVEHHLGGQGREKEALYVNFDVRMSSYYQLGREFAESRGLHLLYHQNPGHATLSVFSAVTRSPFERLPQVTEWKHEVSHDSCWRDIHVFSDVYFEMAKRINEKRCNAGLGEKAPIEMNQNCFFAGIARNTMFEWVKVSVTKDPEDSNNYRRLVTLT